MYAYLIGTVVDLQSDHVVLEVGGIGYLLRTSTATLSQLSLNEEIRLYTRLIVREDALLLYGFYTQEERTFFDLLTKISAVGPKSALAILSALGVPGIIQAVRSNDIQALTKAPGIGKKTASRILLELVDAIQKLPATQSSVLPAMTPSASESNARELAMEALMHLGYSHNDVHRAMAEMDGDFSVEQLVRMGLQKLS